MSYPHLGFDSSNSAVIRFFGSVASVGVHWCPKNVTLKVSQTKLLCPDSLAPEDKDDGWNLQKEKKLKCKRCLAQTASDRFIAVGWDVGKKRWCVFMAHPNTFADIFDMFKARGIPPELIESGMAGEVVVQRMGMKTMVDMVDGTAGVKHDLGAPPSPYEVYKELRKQSLWTKYSTPEEASAFYQMMGWHEPKQETDVLWEHGLIINELLNAQVAPTENPITEPIKKSGIDFSKLLKAITDAPVLEEAPNSDSVIELAKAKKEKRLKAKARAEGPKKKIDPKKLGSADRWDFLT